MLQREVKEAQTPALAESLWAQAGRGVDVLLRAAPGFSRREYSSASVAVTGEPVADLNMAFIWSDSHSSKVIPEYTSMLRAHRAPGLLLVRGVVEASLSPLTEAAGFVRAATLPLMVRGARNLPARSVKGTVEHVETPEQLSTLNQLISQAFDVPLESAHRTFSAALLSEPAFAAFRLVRDGAPVCSLHSTRQGNAVGLWSLGTPAAVQRQGLGRDAMVAAMEWHADRGADSFYLISTPAGQHLYEQLGFEICEEASAWLLPT